jgi:hypothetical protein
VSANAELYKGTIVKKKTNKAESVERCSRAQGSSELSINNVRARINTGGNMWFSESQARYYVPKDGTSTAMFAAALWIGGRDENLQLRVAALRFGQDGEDFWPGPLSVDQNAAVDKTVCEQWDRHYRITKAEVERFIGSFDVDSENKIIPGTYDPETLTDAIRTWPAHGNMSKNQSKYLAPFYDADQDGEYNYANGDYPYYDFENALCPSTKKAALPDGVPYVPDPTMESDPAYGTHGLVPAIGGLLVDQVLKGDETLWWVFNDKGNAHTESHSENPIGLEIRAQAFAFTMNNEINNMTFYSYEIINRSTFTLQDTYFSQWVDPDLGYSGDDFVGCDVERGLGYCYNGSAIDGPGTGAYFGNPPAVGIDFFQGPYMDPDGQDNPKVDTNWFYLTGNQAILNEYRKDSANGPIIPGRSINQILLTNDANDYKLAWYPVGLDSAHTAINACAINGVNFGNGIIDDERFGMRRFVYYNNDQNNNGEPSKASDYYNYLRGVWKDNKRMTFGGNGYNTSPAGAPACDFMFPGNSDIWNWGTRGQVPSGFPTGAYWTEEQAGNSPQDRRFMQSAGPFTLKPGAINYITVGIPWAQAQTGGPMASVELLRVVDDKCQALFDNCFVLLEGPDSPNLTIQELDRELILYLTNEVGNNVNESFDKIDVRIPREKILGDTITRVDDVIDSVYGTDNVWHQYPTKDTIWGTKKDTNDRYYHFEGYQIYQVKDQNVKVDEIYDQGKARLVAQCDIQNGVKKLINFTFDQGIGALKPQVMVDGVDKGISHTFRITDDMFASTNDRKIVNNKKYYYLAIAYAYNNYKSFNTEDASMLDGQKEPYLAGRKLGTGLPIEPVMGIPHKDAVSGNLIQSSYGMMPEIFRIEGNGNGGVVSGLRFQQSTIDALMGKPNEDPTTNFVEVLGYDKNYGPVNVKIVDPLNVKAGNFVLRVVPQDWTPGANITGNIDVDTCYWVITREDGQLIDGKSYIMSDRPLSDIDEHIITELGISISMTNPDPVANLIQSQTASPKRLLGGDLLAGSILTDASNVSFADNTKAWLSGVADNDGIEVLNWVRAGSKFVGEEGYGEGGIRNANYIIYDYDYLTGSNMQPVHTAIDAQSVSESLPGGWAPYRLTSFMELHPAFCEYWMTDIVDTNSPKYVHLLTENPSLISNDLNNLASVDIVFTNDKSKWTRCPVIEMGNDPERTEGNAMKYQLRKHASVDKNGQPEAGTGMGWFPGYAINLETGERLNIVFGENSMHGQHNGRDMQWNPTATISGNEGEVFGGMHYVYVLGTTPYKLYGYANPDAWMYDFTYNITVTPPRYDEGQWAYNLLTQLSNLTHSSSNAAKEQGMCAAHKLFGSVMWVGMPLATAFKSGPGTTLEERSQSNIPTTATVSLRVRKPYAKNWTGANDMASAAQNDNRPMYMFSITNDIATIIGHQPTAESALDLITVVPNPYFAASAYELDQVQNLVKITNVPVNAYITIYTVDGTVVRKLRGSSSVTTNGILPYVEWDLKNHKGLPISGGTYLIHIKADGIGERLIKWFGALRPVDLNSFQN